ncbi:winged helix-turn-helix domain-containing protein [Streptomyces sp. MnatMP-M17]|uniref:winged helix-turn-helix domain-containing protein n=1 Tax=Streptomyces sp. MnatMP-M17 TaxID=1839780 RepID=UPI00210D75EC|nr:winged helix-turn-helix domain-containing protein [Streptomyces sp. MnatMP-M17]
MDGDVLKPVRQVRGQAALCGWNRESAVAGGDLLGELGWLLDVIRNEVGSPPYAQVADILRREITEGTYPPGSQLPPVREIQERFTVANSTAQNAYRYLRQAGLV